MFVVDTNVLIYAADPDSEFHDPCCRAVLHGREVLTPFFQHYNDQHRHTGIGLMTPDNVHAGNAKHITAERQTTLTAAFDRHPNRFKGRAPSPPKVPDKVYINPPRPTDDDTAPKPKKKLTK